METLSHLTGRRRLYAIAVLVVTGLLAAMPARGQEEPGVTPGLEVQPAQLEPTAPIEDRAFAHDILVVNRAGETFQIRMSLAELGHDLDGTPRNSVSSKVERAFSLSDDGFTLDPGERKEVRLDGAIPESDRSIYVSVVTEFAPVGEEQPPTVRTRRRIVSQFLLRGPEPWNEQVKVVDVGLLPAARSDRMLVYASVKNTGNVHVRPRGRVRMFQGKKLLGTVRLTGGNPDRPPAVIPTYTRRLTGLWEPPPGLTGLVSLRATIADPFATGTGTARFAGGAARAPAARIVNLSAVDDDGPLVVATVTNTGTIPITPTITLTAAQSSMESARHAFPRQAMEPGTSRELTWRPELSPGAYRITAQVTQGRTLLDERTTGLRLTAPPAPRTRSPWLLLASLLALAVIAVLLFVVLKRKRTAPGTPVAR